MPTSHVRVQRHFSVEPDVLFARFAEHETMNELFPVKVVRVNDGDTERNGVGSRRRLHMAPGSKVEETITRFEPSTLIEYTITKGGQPLNDHLGTVRFTPSPSGGTDLDYTIRLGSRIPGVAAAVAALLTAVIKRGLPKLDRPA